MRRKISLHEVAKKQRKTWAINPISRIKESKKKYSRKKKWVDDNALQLN